MSKPMEFKMKVLNGVNVKPDNAEFKRYEREDQFWTVEGEDTNTIFEVKYLIYTCSESGQDFDIKKYIRIMKDGWEKESFLPAMMFRDLEHESHVRKKLYENAKNATEKKAISKAFDEKIAIYASAPNEIIMEVEQEGINFLEYETSSCEANGSIRGLNGYIYNVSYLELKNVFNVTGKKLFSENVRIGMENNIIGSKIKHYFKNYIRVGFYLKLEKIKDLQGKAEELMELLAIDSTVVKANTPENFWFYHNGVTIFSYGDEKINRSNNRIKLNPNTISVINGAQTITNLFSAFEELLPDFNTALNSLGLSENYDEEWLNSQMENISKEISIKTIMIDGSKEFVNKISIGLNTQIPIEDKDILAKSKDVETINAYLKQKRISIMREGEVSADNNLSVLEYTKKYLIILGEPGRSKNLGKRDVEKFLKKSIIMLKSDKRDEFLSNLRALIELDEWWADARKRNGGFLGSDAAEYYKYGKNYFGSYLIAEGINDIDTENLGNLFVKFTSDFKTIKEKVTLEDFKNDVLFNKYIEQKDSLKKRTTNQEYSNEINSLMEINKEDLYNYLKNNELKRYSVSSVISEYLTSKEINLPYFRVLQITGDKMPEAYPFPSSTFSELYPIEKDKLNVATVEYNNSLFAKEINKEFPVFLVDWAEESECNENNRLKINNVSIITHFSFGDYSNAAQYVFEKTKEAFEHGDEREFVKSGDGLKFHVKSKASNGNDTFEFSNGMQIAKRTFWANKETVKEIIDKLEKQSQ